MRFGSADFFLTVLSVFYRSFQATVGSPFNWNFVTVEINRSWFKDRDQFVEDRNYDRSCDSDFILIIAI